MVTEVFGDTESYLEAFLWKFMPISNQRLLSVQLEKDEILTLTCPTCGVARMMQSGETDQQKQSNYVCENGHYLYLDVYLSSVKTLNLRFFNVTNN